MANVMVTGGAGFIGANFVLYYMRQHPQDEVTVLDALTYAGNKENLLSVECLDRFSFVRGDICDEAQVRKIMTECRIDTIVHFAAESHVDRSISGPDRFIQTNVVGTHVLLKVAKELWIDSGESDKCRFHHVSTDEVYGDLGPQDPPFTECTPYAPSSPYSASKAASDHLVRAYYRTYGLPVTISNCSNNYGPMQHLEKLVPTVISRVADGQSIPVYGNGQNIRDWLFVRDHCEAIDLILTKGRVGETYNIGGNCEVSNIGMIENICRALSTLFPDGEGYNVESLIEYVEDRPGHDKRYAINSSKIHLDLGWKPKTSLSMGLRETIQWYLA